MNPEQLPSENQTPTPQFQPSQMPPAIIPQPQFSPPSQNSRTGKILIYLVVLIAGAALGAGLMFLVHKPSISAPAKEVTSGKVAETEQEEEEALAQSLANEQRTLDTERQTDIKAMHAHVEAYYAQNGHYPTLTNLNDATFRASNMKGLDVEALRDPAGTETKLVAAATKGAYAYSVADASDKSCNNTTADCVKYTLIATLSDNRQYEKKNLN